MWMSKLTALPSAKVASPPGDEWQEEFAHKHGSQCQEPAIARVDHGFDFACATLRALYGEDQRCLAGSIPRAFDHLALRRG